MKTQFPKLTILFAVALTASVAAVTFAAKSQDKKDIVATAAGAKDFQTLVTAVKAADLVEVLQGKGPFTVFAPTDEAFAKIPKEKLNSLLQDQEALAGVLKYHVVPGKVMAADVVALKTAKTVQGKPLHVSVKEEKVMINNARVIKTDIECTNGVIHVLDTVLLPPTE